MKEKKKKKEIKIDFFYNMNIKQLLFSDLKKRKKNFKSYFPDNLGKKIFYLKKKKLYSFLLKKFSDNLYNATKIFSLIFFGIKLKFFFFIWKIVFDLIFKKQLFEYFLIISFLWKWEHKDDIKFSKEILYEGIIINSSSNLLPKEYFRLNIFLYKKINRFCQINFLSKNERLCKRKFFWLDLIILCVKWSLLLWCSSISLVENLLQICAKELWRCVVLFYMNKHFLISSKKFIIEKKIVLGSLCLIFFPKILSLKSLIPKILSKNFINNYSIAPFCVSFKYLKQKGKQLMYEISKNSFFLKSRNSKQRFTTIVFDNDL